MSLENGARLTQVYLLLSTAMLAIVGWAIVDRINIGAQLTAAKVAIDTQVVYHNEKIAQQHEKDKDIYEIKRQLHVLQDQQKQIMHRLNIPVD